MHHIKPDMDELAKKAAEEYPLKTDTADWESVNKRLHSFKSGTGLKKTNFIIRKNAVLIFALLLIPIGIAITHYTLNNKANATMTLRTEHHEPININHSNEFKSGDKSKILIAGNGANSIEHYDLNNILQPIDKNKTNAINNIWSLHRSDKDINSGITKDIKGNIQQLFAEEEKRSAVVAEQNKSGQNVNELTKEQPKHFYLGLAIAPELTSVKFQSSKKSSNAGLLIGYNLNDKLNIELGIMLARKYYYTDGKYVAPNSIRHDDSKILAVNANSSITEIPLTVQYNFKNNNNTRLFASAGAVSYVIHKEHYNYTFTKNGEQQQGLKYYNKASHDWFANMQLSLGYEYSLNKSCSVRVEPYYRIPLRGIGISDLPVTSVGLNIAFTKKIK
jgi:hypothetical protein